MMVVPHVGTWIEIVFGMTEMEVLKVVPHVGTWIEIDELDSNSTDPEGRSSRRNVD